jgi:hypothetical protein
MKKYLILAGAALLLALAAGEQAWAGGYVVVVPREPVVVYTPGAFTSTIVIEEPAVVIPYYPRYDTHYYGYDAHRHPSYHYGHRGPMPSRGGYYAPSRSGWGSSVGTWGRR